MIPALTIAKKRDGAALTNDEIAAFVAGFSSGEIPDYQMSALAMAIYLRGMNNAETQALTEAMLRSGETLQWPARQPAKVDKHSTGGIGDKVSLILAPLLACFGLHVPMISGRGLGATGGTLDKLEAIPGFRTNLSNEEIQNVIERVGCVITGASANLAPADRKLYALRDVTATVASIPLITASIMSKKLAENLSALVLDVKFGSGAFMKSLSDARKLAESMVETGKRMGVATSALLTDMNQPLGRMIGNAVEVDESIAALQGDSPADLWEVTEALGSELLLSTGKAATIEEAAKLLAAEIHSGRAYQKFLEMVAAQGGDINQPRPRAPHWEFTSPRKGYLTTVDAERLGVAVIELGGGRKKISDAIDHSTGLEMLVRIGDSIEANQPLIRVFGPRADSVSRESTRDAVSQLLSKALTISDEPVAPLAMIAARIT